MNTESACVRINNLFGKKPTNRKHLCLHFVLAIIVLPLVGLELVGFAVPVNKCKKKFGAQTLFGSWKKPHLILPSPLYNN
jgi:hypothetical protein